MSLGVYRSCSRSEKRDVLEAFWRRNVNAPDRILHAALEYGPWAVLCCVVLSLEPVPVLALSIGRVNALAVAAVAVESTLLVSLSWAVVRTTALRRQLVG
jgi:hypothetical protein